MILMPNCSVCGQQFDNDIRFLNHMMEKHGFRNPKFELVYSFIQKKMPALMLPKSSRILVTQQRHWV